MINLWPFPENEVAALKGKKVIVVETNAGQMAREVQRVIGHTQTLSKYNGESLDPGEILELMERTAKNE